MPEATLEQLKSRQQKLKEKIRTKEAELRRAERRRRAHLLIQIGALIFNESVMKKNHWKHEDIELALGDRMGKFRAMVATALAPEPQKTATTTAKAQTAVGSGVGPSRQSVQTPPQ